MNKSVKLTLCELKDATIDIGFVGENLYRTLEIDCAEAYAEYPHAAASMTVQPPEEEAYPAVVERVGNSVVWTLTDSDLAQEGDGEFQLAFTSDEVVRRTWIGTFKIHRSIMPTGNAPSGIDDFLTRAGAALTAIPETIDEALEEAKESGEFDGYSPTVEVTDIPGGHRVSITDVNGTTTVDVMNGTDGEDGYSPTVTVTDIQGGHRVSITDATGTTTFDVMNGATGATPNITIGTVTTGAAGSDAAATMTGTPEDPVLNLTIPRGDPGEVSEEELQEVAEAKADVIKETIDTPADVMSFADGGNGFPLKMQFRLDPIQSGTGDPSPENVRPISGHDGFTRNRTGVNVWDEEWEVGGLVNATGLPYNATDRIRSKHFSPCKPNTTYYKASVGMHTNLFWYDTDMAFIERDLTTSNSVVTSPSNAAFFKLVNTDVTTYKNDISINYPSTDNNYHAYTGTSKSTTFPTPPGTVYGGHVRDNGDGTGTLVVDTAVYTLDGTNNAVNAMSDIGTYKFFSKTNLVVPAPNTTVSNDPPTLWCDTYKTKGGGGLGTAYISGSYFRICADPSFESVEEFNTWLESHNVTFVYKLTTPVTYTLSMDAITSLLGQNNIWVDNGTMESVEYSADTKLYVNKKIKASQRLMELIVTANHEDEMKASKAYSAGDLMIVNATLYKATTSIANGATLTVGTNVSATTVAAEIAALS